MDKQSLYNYVDAKLQVLTELSDKIWDFSDLSLLEFKSAAADIQVLEAEGFPVE